MALATLQLKRIDIPALIQRYVDFDILGRQGVFLAKDKQNRLCGCPLAVRFSTDEELRSSHDVLDSELMDRGIAEGFDAQYLMALVDGFDMRGICRDARVAEGYEDGVMMRRRLRQINRMNNDSIFHI